MEAIPNPRLPLVGSIPTADIFAMKKFRITSNPCVFTKEDKHGKLELFILDLKDGKLKPYQYAKESNG